MASQNLCFRFVGVPKSISWVSRIGEKGVKYIGDPEWRTGDLVSMLEFYGRIARRLQGAKSVFGVIAAVGAVAFVALIFLPGVPAGPTYAFLAITIALWSFFLVLVVKRFSMPLPVIEPGFSLFARFRIRLQRAMLLISAVVLSAMALAIMVYTFIAVGGLLRSL